MPIRLRTKISIHAPAKGATAQSQSRRSAKRFQSTLPRRERLRVQDALLHQLTISIHAPAKGATVLSYSLRVSALFQSTLPRRERPLFPSALPTMWIFQSTLPRRERRAMALCSISKRSRFQSTLPRRERRVSARAPSASQRFQSTLPRRERLRLALFIVQIRDFNPRSREGSDAYVDFLSRWRDKFQSTLPRRERLDTASPIRAARLFQSTLPRRERRISRRTRAAGADAISIHAPAKGATAKITKTIPNDFGKINNYNNSFA